MSLSKRFCKNSFQCLLRHEPKVFSTRSAVEFVGTPRLCRKETTAGTISKKAGSDLAD